MATFTITTDTNSIRYLTCDEDHMNYYFTRFDRWNIKYKVLTELTDSHTYGFGIIKRQHTFKTDDYMIIIPFGWHYHDISGESVGYVLNENGIVVATYMNDNISILLDPVERYIVSQTFYDKNPELREKLRSNLEQNEEQN
jgi:hypothetical protein